MYTLPISLQKKSLTMVFTEAVNNCCSKLSFLLNYIEFLDWGSNDCSHLEDVGLRCSGPDMTNQCVKSCDKGFRKQENSCVKCPMDCRTCKDDGTCLTCADVRYLTGKLIIIKKCVETLE